MVQTILMAQHYHQMSLVGLRIRSTIIGAVFEKSLRVSSAARKGTFHNCRAHSNYVQYVFVALSNLSQVLAAIQRSNNFQDLIFSPTGSTLGEIVNLVSVDSQRFVDLMQQVNELWSAPLTIALSLYFLWNTMGAAVTGGLAVMILLTPLNVFIASKNKNLQIRLMKYKDERSKLMNEILSGIKVCSSQKFTI